MWPCSVLRGLPRCPQPDSSGSLQAKSSIQRCTPKSRFHSCRELVDDLFFARSCDRNVGGQAGELGPRHWHHFSLTSLCFRLGVLNTLSPASPAPCFLASPPPASFPSCLLKAYNSPIHALQVWLRCDYRPPQRGQIHARQHSCGPESRHRLVQASDDAQPHPGHFES